MSVPAINWTTAGADGSLVHGGQWKREDQSGEGVDAPGGAAGGGAAGGSGVGETYSTVVGWVGPSTPYGGDHGRSTGNMQGGVQIAATNAGESVTGAGGDERIECDDACEDDCDYFHLGARTFRAGWRALLSIVTEARMRCLHGAYWEWREANGCEERDATRETYQSVLRELRDALYTGWHYHRDAGGYYTRHDRPGRWNRVTICEMRDNLSALCGYDGSNAPEQYDACLGMEVLEQYCE